MLLAETDHLFLRVLPNTATPEKAIGYPFHYMDPKRDANTRGLVRRFAGSDATAAAVQQAGFVPLPSCPGLRGAPLSQGVAVATDGPIAAITIGLQQPRHCWPCHARNPPQPSCVAEGPVHLCATFAPPLCHLTPLQVGPSPVLIHMSALRRLVQPWCAARAQLKPPPRSPRVWIWCAASMRTVPQQARV